MMSFSQHVVLSGDMVTVSDPIGSFNLSRLKRAKTVFMISAGTGIVIKNEFRIFYIIVLLW